MTRNLSDVVNQLPLVSGTQGFTSYLTVFAVNLSIRYPNLTVETIDTAEVRRIADLSAICSVVAFDAWDKFMDEDRRRQGGIENRLTRRTG